MLIRHRLLLASLLLLLGASNSFSQSTPANSEAELAMQRFRLPPGFKIELFAAEPQLVNPVAFCLDERGRVYVAETFRLHFGVTDNRRHMEWLDADLASRTVEDRVAMYKKFLGADFASYERESDRVRLVEDRDDDGRADASTVFAENFKNAADGIGAGVLAHGGNVYYTCIPDLWLLRDENGDGKSDTRRSLSTGYGVHVAFLGHDLHGLQFGPDGKLYFSVGDRGLHVKTNGQTLDYPDTGAVLRCNPDGSELEVFAHGLRNPQELAFDHFGNLFTGDNNSDSGDEARFVYLVEGGDSGWRMSYQYITRPVSRGPWNAERLWNPAFEGQAAYIVPPIINLANGPSGLAFDPGVGLPAKYRHHFLMADFRGSSSNSGIHSFAVKPRGASFELIDRTDFVWSVLATDVDFGPDGAVYISDWVEGWELPGKGRIYRVFDPVISQDPLVGQVRTLLQEGMHDRPTAELVQLLAHADRRIRQAAQFELAARGDASIADLAKVAQSHNDLLARLHAIWGLGQVGRKNPAATEPIVGLLNDKTAEVRAQAAKVLGETRTASAAARLLPLLEDAEDRVKFFAAQSLGKLGDGHAIAPLFALLRENADQDAYLRHAAAYALGKLAKPEQLLPFTADESRAARMGALLALRHQRSAEVARSLKDGDPLIVTKAARAINDVPIADALPQLAELIDRIDLPEPALFRAINANFILGGAQHSAAVAAFAASADAPEQLRVEALRALTDWAEPSGRDRVLGLWRPLPQRSADVARNAVEPVLGGIFSGPDRVRTQGARLTARLGITQVGPVLLELIADRSRSADARVEASQALESLGDARVTEAMELALKDSDPLLRTEGRRLLARLRPDESLPVLQEALRDGTLADQQGALAILGSFEHAGADEVLAQNMDRLLQGELPIEVHLDLLTAAAEKSSEEIAEKLARFEAARGQDALGPYREALAGGNAENGRQIFFERAQLSCLRCHKLGTVGGEVGPDLTTIGARQKREYLLESIVAPNQTIAQNFETVVVVTSDGLAHTGILKAEDDRELTLITPEAKRITIPKDQIEERARGPSSMPDALIKYLTKAELRDLIEFLAQQK